MGDKLTDLFEDMGRAAARSYNRRRPKQTQADAELVATILADVDVGEFQTGMGAIYRGAYQQSAALTLSATEQLIGQSIDIGVRDQVAEHILREGGRHAGLVDLSGQSKRALFQALESARSQGMSIPQTARHISGLVSAGPYPNAGARYRATTIARTETRFATNMSVSEVGQAAGFEVYLAFDDRIGFGDTDCVARDGQTFSVVEMEAEIAAEHPNGTLSFSPVPTDQVRDGDPTNPDEDDWQGREFRTGTEADRWLDNNSGPLRPHDVSGGEGLISNTADTERRDVAAYKDGGYSDINSALRKGISMDDAIQIYPYNDPIALRDVVGPLDRAINRTSLQENIVVHRRVRNLKDFIPTKRGAIFQDPGYVSTSLNPARPGPGRGISTVDIRLPKGSPALSPSSTDFEMELILPRGSRFEVIGENSKGDLVLELLP